MLFVVAGTGAGGRDQGAAGGPQVAGAGVGGAGVQRVLRGGTAPTPSSTPAGPEKSHWSHESVKRTEIQK